MLKIVKSVYRIMRRKNKMEQAWAINRVINREYNILEWKKKILKHKIVFTINIHCKIAPQTFVRAHPCPRSSIPSSHSFPTRDTHIIQQ